MEIDTGNTAWLLLSSALVLLMTPGLALFYGGLNRSKGVLNMMMMSFSSIGLVSVLWVIYGFTLAFGTNGNSGVNNVLGSFTQYLGTQTNFLGDIWGTTGIPVYVFLVFQMMFAIITVALISGAASDRMKFAGWLLFAAGWFTLVYIPVAHWVWGGGFIGAKIHALDFAGGTAVHINAGAAALGLVLVLGKRIGWPKESTKPHNVPLVALGAGLLWFGWFGFNAGSELTVDGTTAVAFLNTQVATAAGVLGWIIVEWIKGGKPTLVGASSGAIAGLVAITPACGFIAPIPAVIVGAIAGAVCALAVSLKYRFGFDDSLDVVGVHFVGGWIGSLAIGFFATTQVNSAITDVLGASNGIFYGGGATQLGRQFAGSAIVTVYSLVLAMGIAWVVKKVVGLRTAPESEVEGIDVAEHAESAYDLSPAGGGGAASAFQLAGLSPARSNSEVPDEKPVSEKVSG
ncbi:ammonium transporter [Asanoa iriomotensis]|uniref:Ammonium transporter n=1 Tax=Asanoa iriomotensis TaxID=234613 RepID=A0ABQ4CA11_9ACTN|nr:ammonium transporter [Asanoa iriomotensis]GIF59291.1 ammonium transporter [Asanoa iriomotensis]